MTQRSEIRGPTPAPERRAGRNPLLESVLRLEPTLRAHIKLVEYPAGKQLCDEGRPLAFVHFPLSGVLSCLIRTRDGEMSEVMSVGKEGFIGLPLYFGVRFSTCDL